MKITSEHDIPGRGHVVCCALENGDRYPEVGDKIVLGDCSMSVELWEVKGIETSLLLSDPPKLSRTVALVVRKIK